MWRAGARALASAGRLGVAEGVGSRARVVVLNDAKIAKGREGRKEVSASGVTVLEGVAESRWLVGSAWKEGIAGACARISTVDEARRIQIEIFRSWTPEERVRRGMELTQICLRARDARIREQNPGVSEEEFRRIRLEEILAASARERRLWDERCSLPRRVLLGSERSPTIGEVADLCEARIERESPAQVDSDLE